MTAPRDFARERAREFALSQICPLGGEPTTPREIIAVGLLTIQMECFYDFVITRAVDEFKEKAVNVALTTPIEKPSAGTNIIAHASHTIADAIRALKIE